jgi:hypothetical protein
MAVKIIANYSKRLGLPGYSSHQFSVSVERELTSTDNVSTEASALYDTLQRQPSLSRPDDLGRVRVQNFTPSKRRPQN